MDLVYFLAQAAPEESSPMYPMLFFFAVVGVAFYFLILRPQKAEQAKREEKLSAIKKNDQVVTAGGFWGKVTNAGHEDYVEVEIAKNTVVKINRSSIAVVKDKDEKDKKESDKSSNKK